MTTKLASIALGVRLAGPSDAFTLYSLEYIVGAR